VIPAAAEGIIGWRLNGTSVSTSTENIFNDLIHSPRTISEQAAVGSGKLLLGLASTVILVSESRGTHIYILLSHDSRSRATPEQVLFEQTL
jgi:hypothetical protein